MSCWIKYITIAKKERIKCGSESTNKYIEKLERHKAINLVDKITKFQFLGPIEIRKCKIRLESSAGLVWTEMRKMDNGKLSVEVSNHSCHGSHCSWAWKVHLFKLPSLQNWIQINPQNELSNKGHEVWLFHQMKTYLLISFYSIDKSLQILSL